MDGIRRTSNLETVAEPGPFWRVKFDEDMTTEGVTATVLVFNPAYLSDPDNEDEWIETDQKLRRVRPFLTAEFVEDDEALVFEVMGKLVALPVC